MPLPPTTYYCETMALTLSQSNTHPGASNTSPTLFTHTLLVPFQFWGLYPKPTTSTHCSFRALRKEKDEAVGVRVANPSTLGKPCLKTCNPSCLPLSLTPLQRAAAAAPCWAELSPPPRAAGAASPRLTAPGAAANGWPCARAQRAHLSQEGGGRVARLFWPARGLVRWVARAAPAAPGVGRLREGERAGGAGEWRGGCAA